MVRRQLDQLPDGHRVSGVRERRLIISGLEDYLTPASAEVPSTSGGVSGGDKKKTNIGAIVGGVVSNGFCQTSATGVSLAAFSTLH